jgi:hypothetical protein
MRKQRLSQEMRSKGSNSRHHLVDRDLSRKAAKSLDRRNHDMA